MQSSDADKEAAKAFYARHQDAIRARRRAAYAENPEPEKAYQIQYYATHREEAIQRRKANDEALLQENPTLAIERQQRKREATARYREEHPDVVRETSRAWRIAHKDMLNARKRQRYAEDSTPQLASNRKRRARRRGATISDLTAAQWLAIKAHYGYRCVYCGIKTVALTQEHITPLSKGGNHTVQNVVPACMTCNCKKQAGEVPKPIQPLLII